MQLYRMCVHLSEFTSQYRHELGYLQHDWPTNSVHVV
jgi:hypothetical protein